VRHGAIVLSVLAVLTPAACGGQPQSAPGASVSVSPAQRTPAESRTPSPTPTGPILPKAADGTDISACFDGTCEVQVRAPLDIPFNPKSGIRKLSVDEVSAEGVTITGATTTGTNYEVRLFTDPGGLATSTINNKILIAALGVDKGVAVVRISPK
jgi:hypothetical protein